MKRVRKRLDLILPTCVAEVRECGFGRVSGSVVLGECQGMWFWVGVREGGFG